MPAALTRTTPTTPMGRAVYAAARLHLDAQRVAAPDAIVLTHTNGQIVLSHLQDATRAHTPHMEGPLLVLPARGAYAWTRRGGRA